ncbi:MAG: PilZ domain-containing protein [Candidatus Omnitrophica bacterium]|nr:PilZ domain-containing protein [Candidatus Omnitrophota bacterium]
MNDQDLGLERRRHKRVKVDFAAVCRTQELFKSRTIVEPRDIVAKMFDISESGMGILSDYNFSPHTNIQAKFTLVNLGAKELERYLPMEVMGEVRYNIPFKDNLRRLGVFFTNLSSEDRHTLADFAGSRVR